MAAMPEKQRIRELEVERLVLREPNDGRLRAVLETTATRDPDRDVLAPTVRLTLLDPVGEPAFVAEVDGNGEARLSVGHPDRGQAVIVSRSSVDVWAGGNVVASFPVV